MLSGITTVILKAMKTAVSVPDELFESAERFAEQAGMSRSELYATALRRYLQERRGEDLIKRLNEVYGSEPIGLDPEITRLQAHSLRKDEW